MSTLRILLINQYFPPDTAATAKMTALVAGALAKRHKITVLAGRPSYDPTERHPAYLLRRQQMNGAIVARVGSTASSRFRMRDRLANYFSYLLLAVPHALISKADVVLAMTDPPVVGIAGALVAAARQRPFVYNIRDLYPDMAVAAGLLRPGPLAAAWERLHRWALRRADRVVVLGEDMRERIVAKGIPAERVVVVRDGATIPAAVPRRDHPVVQEVRSGFRFVVLHAGNMGFYGAWETLVRAAALLNGDGAGFVFIGAGAAAARVQALATSANGHIRFLPFRPASEVPYVLAAANLHVVTVRRGLEGVVVPSKLYGILAAGCPVLAVAPEGSDVARIVRRYGCGFVADPDRPDAVAQAVREAMTSPDSLAAMGARARAAARDFEQQVQLDRFIEVVEAVCGVGSAGAIPAPSLTASQNVYVDGGGA
jgi:colanic acid biosynthesis glycosyl transferase WcaI